jgi:ATP/maltotriose-dependent transcriptional regulator MalT
LRLAVEADSLELAADIEREAGYVSFLGANYGAAEVALHRSLSLAARCGDEGRVGRAMTILAACRSDEGALDAALVHIDRALLALEAAGDRRWHAYALSFLARIRLAAGDPVDAAAVAGRSVAEAREAGWTALVPFPMTFEGEALLAAGDALAAATVFGEALTMAEEMGDPCRGAWLDPVAGKVFCLASGPDSDAVLRIHERAGHPTAEIYELPVEV